MEIRDQLGIDANEVANLIQSHQDILEQDDSICEAISGGRSSMEFFIALGDDSRALYEVRQTKEAVMRFLGLKD